MLNRHVDRACLNRESSHNADHAAGTPERDRIADPAAARDLAGVG